jgi:hypothetical protein
MTKRTVTDRYRLLEMAIRDGLDNLEEFTRMMAYQADVSNLEILSVSNEEIVPEKPKSRVTRIDNKPDNVIYLQEALERRLKKRQR